MKTYLAKIIFRINIAEAEISGQFDEQIRLIRAANENEAVIKAKMIGVRSEDSFVNDGGNLVSWEFIDVCELKCADDCNDGEELFSQVNENASPENYIRFIRLKAEKIASASFIKLAHLTSH